MPLLANKLDVFAIPEIYKQAGISGISFNERYFASRDQAYIARLREAVKKAADNILKMIKATDPKYVGALLDFGNFHGDGRYDDIAKLAPYALSTHVKVGKVDGRGEVTEYDLPRVLGILKKSGFKGSLSIEYIGPLEPAEGVRVGRDLVRKYW